jgi:hypothetical protein
MEYTNAPWYKKIITECNTLAEKFGLDDLLGQEFRDFVIRVARDQYKVGNKSGIAWLKSEQAKAAQTAQPA